MNGRKAKKIRKIVYGSDFSIRERVYVKNTKTGVIINKPGSRRSIYQNIKKEFKNKSKGVSFDRI